MWIRRVEQKVIVERHADVERTRETHRPSPETLPAPGHYKECREPADQHERQHEVDIHLFEHGAAEREETTKREQEPARRAGSHSLGQAEKLPEGQASQQENQAVD